MCYYFIFNIFHLVLFYDITRFGILFSFYFIFSIFLLVLFYFYFSSLCGLVFLFLFYFIFKQSFSHFEICTHNTRVTCMLSFLFVLFNFFFCLLFSPGLNAFWHMLEFWESFFFPIEAFSLIQFHIPCRTRITEALSPHLASSSLNSKNKSSLPSFLPTMQRQPLEDPHLLLPEANAKPFSSHIRGSSHVFSSLLFSPFLPSPPIFSFDTHKPSSSPIVSITASYILHTQKYLLFFFPRFDVCSSKETKALSPIHKLDIVTSKAT